MTNKTKNTSAAVYVRVSTLKQKNEGISIEAQETMCREAAGKDPFNVEYVIKDEGKSGGSIAKRQGMQEVIRLITSKSIGALYMVSSDRLARNTVDDIMVRDICRKNNVLLKCLNQPDAEDNAMSRMVNTVFASFNQMQRDITSEKVKQTMTVKAEAGYFPSMAPLGYRNAINPNENVETTAKKIIIADPESAPFITTMFKLYSTGNFNVHDLTDLLYEKGLRTKKGGHVSPTRTFQMLRDRAYLGELHWGETHLKEGKHPALIDEATFNRVQSVLNSNNQHACRRRKHNFLLNGFVYCGRCGRRYTAEWHTAKGVAYYHCTNPKGGCGRFSRHLPLEKQIGDKFKELEFQPDFIDRVFEKVRGYFVERRDKYNARKQSLVNQRTAVEAKLRTLENKLIEGVLTNNDFTRRRSEFSDAIALIDHNLHELEQEQKTSTDIAQEILFFMKDIYGAYEQASPNLKRLFLAFFWERFDVADTVIIKSTLGPLFDAIVQSEKAYYNSDSLRKTNEIKGKSMGMISTMWSTQLESNQRPSP